jgi:hypothetical protein
MSLNSSSGEIEFTILKIFNKLSKTAMEGTSQLTYEAKKNLAK